MSKPTNQPKMPKLTEPNKLKWNVCEYVLFEFSFKFEDANVRNKAK